MDKELLLNYIGNVNVLCKHLDEVNFAALTHSYNDSEDLVEDMKSIKEKVENLKKLEEELLISLEE